MAIKRKSGTKLYYVEHGYITLCAGTLSQCQRVQSAISACEPVETRYIDNGDADERNERVFVTTEDGPVVLPMKCRLMSEEEFERESIRKIGYTPSDQVKGGVV